MIGDEIKPQFGFTKFIFYLLYVVVFKIIYCIFFVLSVVVNIILMLNKAKKYQHR